MPPSAGPLRGILVVDLSRALAGPQAAMMLGDLGARVIKIENPSGGDDTRGWGPPFVAISIFGGDVVVAAESSWLAALPLEGAAGILYGDGTRAVEAAVAQRVGAPDLLADGIIDRIVAEPDDDDPAVFADAMIAACAEELARLVPATRTASSAGLGGSYVGMWNSQLPVGRRLARVLRWSGADARAMATSWKITDAKER